ncbi:MULTISPECIES: hypothetical protein [unclassified Mycolicibacterium]
MGYDAAPPGDLAQSCSVSKPYEHSTECQDLVSAACASHSELGDPVAYR